MNAGSHWDSVYRAKAPDAVSWYRPHLEISLDLIGRAAPGPQASIIDVGAGESTLIDDLLARGYRDITVLDVSETALRVTKERVGSAAANVHWLLADITHASLPDHAFDVWHDRAVFHFLTSPAQRAAYVLCVLRAVRPGGHVIVGTFGPEGPSRCSGLEAVRYDAPSLHHEFGARFQLLESVQELHRTPWGATQQFLYCYCKVE